MTCEHSYARLHGRRWCCKCGADGGPEDPDLLTAIEKALELPERDAYTKIIALTRDARART